MILAMLFQLLQPKKYKKQYPLTIEIEGDGTVTETVIKQGLATDYNSGTIVELTAEPTGDWEFNLNLGQEI